MELFPRLLQSRIAGSGSTPLITYYDQTRGERIELSGRSFGNWVDKTAGLLTDEILVEPGDRVRLGLAATHPAHWVTLVWAAAGWRAGCAVTLRSDDDAAVDVIGPDQPPGPGETIACSLHPFGLGFSTPLPQGVLDYGVEVRAHPDVFTGPQPAPADVAWIDDERTLTHSDVVSGPVGDPARRLIVPGPAAWSTVYDALVEPIRTGGSTVIVVGADADRLAEIAAVERAMPMFRR